MFRLPRMEDNRSCQTCMSISMYFSGGQIDNILLQASELAINLCYSVNIGVEAIASDATEREVNTT